MADIFISYARSDRDRVEQLAEKLKAHGNDVWWDRNLVGGDEFAALIEQELEAAHAVVVVWSATSVKSHWVRDEASFAARAGKLVAISADGTPPPMGFGQFHSIDFCHPDGKDGDEALEQLLRAIAARQGQTPEHAASRPARKAPGSVRKRPADDMPWIAMLPIKVRGSDPDLPNLAEDLTQNIASGLARFSYLKVGMERSGAEGRRAGAGYVLDCTLRQAGARLRLAVRLSDSDDDRQVWGENYNREYDPETIFDVQDDLTDHLVASVADPYGALMHDLTAPVLELEPQAMTPYQALLRYFVYRQRVTPEDHAIALEAIEVACERQPLNPDLWAAKAFLEMEAYKNRFNVTRNSAQPSVKSARQAVALNPQSAFAHYALFECSFHAGDFQGASAAAAQRCLALNPRDTDTAAMIGIYLMFLGDWEEGRAVARRALELHANGPGWYRYGLVCYAMREGRFEEALGELGRANMPQYHVHQALLTQTYSGLGRFEDAHTAWRGFLEVWPEDMASYREHLQRWHVADPDFHNLLLSLFEKAGISLEDGSVRQESDKEPS